jgi:autotransporter-associated beta strand protein
MKIHPHLGLFAIFGCTLVYSASAADIIKDNNTSNMNLAGSWVGGIVPGPGDLAVFNDVFASTASVGTGGLLKWSGLKVVGSNSPGQILVNNTTTANAIQTGTGGIDMAVAPRDVSIASFDINGTQTWSVAAGRTLSLGKSSTNGHEKITGVTGGTVTITGGGILLMEGNGNTGGGTGGGGKNHNANLVVTSGTTLQVTAGTAIGTATGTTTIEDGGSLVMSATGINMQGESFIVGGTGVNGLGVIQNTSGAQLQTAFTDVTLTADSLFSVGTRFDIRDTARAGFDSLDLAGFTLTKTGPDVLYFDGCTITSGDIVIEQGELGFQNGVIVAPAPSDLVTVKNGASLRFWRSPSGIPPCEFGRAVVIEDGGSIRWNGNDTPDAVDQKVDSPISISGTATFQHGVANNSVFELAGAITGTGAVNMTGTTGVFRLSGVNTYSGLTDVQAGIARIDGSVAGPVAIAAGATVEGNGSIGGPVTLNGAFHLAGTAGGGVTSTVSGSFNPGGPGVVGALHTASLDINDSTLSIDSTGGGNTDTITIAPGGTFTASGVTDVNFKIQGGWQVAQYEFIQFSGSTTPPNANPNTYLNLLSSLGHATGQMVATGSGVALNITSAPLTVWNGNLSPEWDLGSLNWKSSDGLYLEGDSVVFDDTAAGNFNVNLDSVVEPGAVSFNNSANDYSLASALNTGGIGGAVTALTKSGGRTATIGTTNTYGGGTVINAGILALLSNAVNLAPSLSSGPIRINSPGSLTVGFEGALPNAITGDGSVLKSHPTDNTFTVFTGASDFTGPTVVANGTLSIGSSNALGDVSGATTVQDAARLYIGAPLANGSTISEPVTLMGGPDLTLPDFQIGNNLTGIVFAGPITLHNDVAMGFDAGTAISFTAADSISHGGAGPGSNLEIIGGGNATLTGALKLGTGSLVMNGTGTLTLGGAGNTYQGTSVNSGTLALTGDGKLGGGSTTVAAGAVLALAGPLKGPLTASATGDGLLAKTGTGDAELAAVNNLTGGTRIDGGLLLIGGDGLLGTGQVHLNGGSLASKDGNPRTVANPVLLGNNAAFGDLAGVLAAPVTYTGDVSFGGVTRFVRAFTPTVWATGSGNGGMTQKLGASTLTLQGTHDWSAGAEHEIRQGTEVIDGATVTNKDALRIMATTAGSTARFSIINGGSFTIQVATANLRLGYTGGDGTATNIVDIGGTLNLPAGNTGGKVQLGTSSAATVLNLNAGGNLLTAAIQDNNALSNDVVNCNGGKLTVIADSTNTAASGFMQGLDAVRVLDGGLTIDTNGNSALLNQPMQAAGANVGGLNKQGAGTLTLGGINAYGGPTVVEAGTLAVLSPGTTGVGSTTVQAGATLAGTGTVNAGAAISGTIAPGTSAGALTVGGILSLAPSSSYRWEASSWTQLLPGINYDTVVATSLDIAVTPSNPLTIVIAGTPGDFSESNAVFPLVQTSGGISGFASNKLVVDASGFSGTGTWSVRVSGNNLELVYTVSAGNDYQSWADSFSLVGTDRELTADPDGDGMSNRDEYAFGLNPTNGSSVAPVIIPLAKTTGFFTYTRRKPSLSGYAFSYQSSLTLSGPWSSLTPDSEASNNGNPIEQITVDVPDALLAEPKVFVRVLATGP